MKRLGAIWVFTAALLGGLILWWAPGPVAVAQPAAGAEGWRSALTSAELTAVSAKSRAYIATYEQAIMRAQNAQKAATWNSLVLNNQSRIDTLGQIISRQLASIRAGKAAAAGGARDLGAVRRNFVEVVAEREAVLAVQPRAVAAANRFKAGLAAQATARPSAPANVSARAAGSAAVPPGRAAAAPSSGSNAPPGRATAAMRSPPPNMGGLKLGMTPAQVRQVLIVQASPYKVREQAESLRIGDRTYNHTVFEASRGGPLTRGGAATEAVRVDFAGPAGRETAMRLAKTISYPIDARPSYDAAWAELDRSFGRFEPGLRPSNKDRAAIVMDFKGGRMANTAYTYDLCASFAVGQSGGIGFVGARIEPPTDCGLIAAHQISYDINDPTQVTSVSFGTLDYGQTVRAVYQGLGRPPPYLGPTNKRPSAMTVGLPAPPAPFQIERNPPRVCYRLNSGVQQCSDVALRCQRACVFGGPNERGACRRQCATNRGLCETDARGRAAVSTCP